MRNTEKIHQRLAPTAHQPQLGDDEQYQACRRYREAADGPGAGPAPFLALDQGQDQEEEGTDAEKGPHEIDTLRRPLLARLAHQEDNRHQAQHPQAHVQPEDGAPAEALHQPAAEDRPYRQADAGDAEDTYRRAQFRADEGDGDDRQGHRQVDRAAHPHQGTPRDHQVDIGGQRAEQGSEHEGGDTDKEDALATEDVAELDGEDRQAGCDQGVGGGDPLQIGERRVKGTPDIGQRHVDDRDAHGGEEGNQD